MKLSMWGLFGPSAADATSVPAAGYTADVHLMYLKGHCAARSPYMVSP